MCVLSFSGVAVLCLFVRKEFVIKFRCFYFGVYIYTYTYIIGGALLARDDTDGSIILLYKGRTEIVLIINIY